MARDVSRDVRRHAAVEGESVRCGNRSAHLHTNILLLSSSSRAIPLTPSPPFNHCSKDTTAACSSVRVFRAYTCGVQVTCLTRVKSAGKCSGAHLFAVSKQEMEFG